MKTPSCVQRLKCGKGKWLDALKVLKVLKLLKTHKTVKQHARTPCLYTPYSFCSLLHEHTKDEPTTVKATKRTTVTKRVTTKTAKVTAASRKKIPKTTKTAKVDKPAQQTPRGRTPRKRKVHQDMKTPQEMTACKSDLHRRAQEELARLARTPNDNVQSVGLLLNHGLVRSIIQAALDDPEVAKQCESAPHNLGTPVKTWLKHQEDLVKLKSGQRKLSKLIDIVRTCDNAVSYGVKVRVRPKDVVCLNHSKVSSKCKYSFALNFDDWTDDQVALKHNALVVPFPTWTISMWDLASHCYKTGSGKPGQTRVFTTSPYDQLVCGGKTLTRNHPMFRAEDDDD